MPIGRSTMILFCVALASACVRFEGLPDMPAGMGSDPAVYASGKKDFPKHVTEARLLVREANLSWTLVGTAGENLASYREIREKYGGIIFVGDSQIREIAWAAMQMLTPGQPKLFHRQDKVFARLRPPGKSACVPQTIGKTGFTASCGRRAFGSKGELLKPGTEPEECSLHSPFKNKSHAEAMRRLLLTQPHKWDGKLSVSETVCGSDFFLSYQATWGAMPVDPMTLPSCLHPRNGGSGDGRFMLPHRNSGKDKPVLWVMDGCGLHEMEFCDPRRWQLAQHVLPRFPDNLLSSGTVVWQTVGAGFLMKAAKRFKGECSDINADQVAATELSYLQPKGVRVYNYTKLALQYAPMMFDAIHFTYYWVPCAYTFPEMARLVAQLAFQQAVGRPVEVCGPNTPVGPPRVIDPAEGAPRLGEPGGTHVSLAQDAEQALGAYAAALRLSGKAVPAGVSGAKGGKKGEKPKKGAHGGGGGGGGGGGDALAKVNAALLAEQTSLQQQREAQQQLVASAVKDAQAAQARQEAELAPMKELGPALQSAIHKVAAEFGSKKRQGELESAIAKLAKQYHAHSD